MQQAELWSMHLAMHIWKARGQVVIWKEASNAVRPTDDDSRRRLLWTPNQ